jgi:addiction module HigA family antidote
MHPGEFLRTVVIPGSGMTKTNVAKRLRVSRQTLYEVLRERSPITTNLALRLARLFGNAPQYWLNLQANHDVAVLTRAHAAEIAKITPLGAA